MILLFFSTIAQKASNVKKNVFFFGIILILPGSLEDKEYLLKKRGVKKKNLEQSQLAKF